MVSPEACRAFLFRRPFISLSSLWVAAAFLTYFLPYYFWNVSHWVIWYLCRDSTDPACTLKTFFKGPPQFITCFNIIVTSINDVRRFSPIFDLPTYHVWRFLPYNNIQYFGAFLDPPTYPKIGCHLWTFPKGVEMFLLSFVFSFLYYT